MAIGTQPELENALSTLDPDILYEVVDGEIVKKSQMGAFEYNLAFLIALELGTFAKPRKIGHTCVEMMFDLRPKFDRQRRPDAAFVSAARWPLNVPVPKTAAWAVIPDLVIEIVSPSNSATEVLEKVDEYFRAGVKLVWVVYPAVSQIYAYDSISSIRVFGPGTEIDGGTVLTDFRLSISELFGAPAAPV